MSRQEKTSPHILSDQPLTFHRSVEKVSYHVHIFNVHRSSPWILVANHDGVFDLTHRYVINFAKISLDFHPHVQDYNNVKQFDIYCYSMQRNICKNYFIKTI